MSNRKTGWIGVDLDGTLAHYDRWRGEKHIGAPIGPMVERVKGWLAEGYTVKVFTARMAAGENRDGTPRDIAGVIETIQAWTEEHIGTRLEVTNVKDFGMIVLWDDRAVQVLPNTGIPWERATMSEPDLIVLDPRDMSPEALKQTLADMEQRAGALARLLRLKEEQAGLRPTLASVLADVEAEVGRAERMWPPMNSAHEALEVLEEEFVELQKHVHTKQTARNLEEMRKEAIQVAAMAVRFVRDICDGGRGRK